MKVEITKDFERGLETILNLKEAYFKNTFFNFTNVPDEILPSGMTRASNEHLLFLTFVSSIAYLRKEEQLWSAARLTWEDPSTRYVFNPQEVLETDIEKLEKDLYKYNLFEDIIQARKWSVGNILIKDQRRSRENDIVIWKSMAKILREHESNVYKLFKNLNNDAFRIIEVFLSDEYSKCFPEYHKKMKIVVWLTRIHRNSELLLKNIDKLSVPIDLHIIRATFMSGSITGKVNSIDTNLEELCSDFWMEVYEQEKDKIKMFPVEFELFLWVLGKYGCSISRNDKICRFKNVCPIGDKCSMGHIEMLDGYTKIEIIKNENR